MIASSPACRASTVNTEQILLSGQCWCWWCVELSRAQHDNTGAGAGEAEETEQLLDRGTTRGDEEDRITMAR